MTARKVRFVRLNLDREVIKEGRAPGNHVLLDAGHYVIDQQHIDGAYNPFALWQRPDSPEWYHELHLAIVPLDGPERFAPQVHHQCIRNADDPGPHPSMVSARQAFRAIPAADRSFVLQGRSSVTLWIQAGEYGSWQPDRFACGTVNLLIFRVEA